MEPPVFGTGVEGARSDDIEGGNARAAHGPLSGSTALCQPADDDDDTSHSHNGYGSAAHSRVDSVRFVTGDVLDTLPATLSAAFYKGVAPREVAVLACHACSHLTDSIIDVCVSLGVDFAVMPCCHRDLRTQGQMAICAKTLGVSEHAVIDVARLGAITAQGFDCRWRTIDATITPENRMLVGLAHIKPGVALQRKLIEDSSGAKLKHIYSRLHDGPKRLSSEPASESPNGPREEGAPPAACAAVEGS